MKTEDLDSFPINFHKSLWANPQLGPQDPRPAGPLSVMQTESFPIPVRQAEGATDPPPLRCNLFR